MDSWHTNACCVHSNVYGLGNVHWIRYLTPVDPFHSTSSVVQTYHHMMCIHVEITKSTTVGISGNFRSIGKKPVPYDGPIFILIIFSTRSNWVCNTEQGIIIFTNVLQGLPNTIPVQKIWVCLLWFSKKKTGIVNKKNHIINLSNHPSCSQWYPYKNLR